MPNTPALIPVDPLIENSMRGLVENKENPVLLGMEALAVANHFPIVICYNDVDKGDYPDVWRMAKNRIRPDGLYLADNVLWQGRVAVESYTDIVPGWTEAIREHNALIFSDPEFDAYINPTRDGVLVARKKTG